MKELHMSLKPGVYDKGGQIVNTKMFIFSHKPIDFVVPDGYSTLLVGTENNKNVLNYSYYDNCGDNISTKNKNYCELTGVYWIWKNISADVVGCCHYRRYFTKANFSISSKYFPHLNDIDHMMEKYDVIVPKPRYYKKSILKSVNIAPNRNDMREIGEAIQKVCPEYLQAYYDFLYNNKTYLYNMCIMKKPLFDNYCKWLFDILFYIEKEHDMSQEDDYRLRLFGFLSERLLTVWINKNIIPEKVKTFRVIKTDESALKNKLHDIKNGYINWVWKMDGKKLYENKN